MSSRRKVPNILFVHNDDPRFPLSSFFVQDIEILRKYYEVDVVSINPFKHAHLDALLSASLWRRVSRCDAVFGWFGSSSAIVFMARILCKPSLIIAGGADITYVPEINYGLNPARRGRYLVYLLGYKLVNRILLFSDASREDYLRLPGADEQKAQTLYLGVDSNHYCQGGAKLPQVLTVSYITESALIRKGLLTFIESARLTPDISYRIAGLVQDHEVATRIKMLAPPNVAFLGYLSEAQLLKEMQDSRVYAQLSFHEGFGMAVAEAMACGCIPVVTRRGSLPEVVGDTGFYVPVADAAATAQAVRAAISEENAPLGERARDRIKNLFQPSSRDQVLHTIMEELLSR